MHGTNRSALGNFTYDDDYDGYIDHEALPCHTYMFVMLGVLSCTLCVAGILGNGLSLIVLSKMGKASVTFFLLKVLACMDGLYLMVYLVTTSVPGILGYFHYDDSLLPVISFYLFPVASMALTGTIWITTLVTIHRYLCVCFPLSPHKFSKMQHAYWQVALVTIIAIAMDLPRYFESKLTCIPIENSSSCYYEHDRTALWYNKGYQLIYKTVVVFVIRKLVPIILVSILTYKLVKQLITRQEVRRTSFRKNADTSESITKVLVTVTIVFIVCQLPMAIYPIIRLIMGLKVKTCENFYSYFAVFADFLSLVNSAVNFCIYYPAIPAFRFKLMELLCCCCEGSPTSTSTLMSDDRRSQAGSLKSNQPGSLRVKQLKNGSMKSEIVGTDTQSNNI